MTLRDIADIQRRAAENAATSRVEQAESDSSSESHRPASSLAPVRHPQQDFFLAQTFDAALKDDHASMEHPMFSLSKARDLEIRVYEHNGNSITIRQARTAWQRSGTRMFYSSRSRP